MFLPTQMQVTVLEKIGYDAVKVILPNGQLTTVSPAHLDLPIIDTQSYEKLRNVEA